MVRDPSIVSPSLTGVFIGGGHNKHGTGSRCRLIPLLLVPVRASPVPSVVRGSFVVKFFSCAIPRLCRTCLPERDVFVKFFSLRAAFPTEHFCLSTR